MARLGKEDFEVKPLSKWVTVEVHFLKSTNQFYIKITKDQLEGAIMPEEWAKEDNHYRYYGDNYTDTLRTSKVSLNSLNLDITEAPIIVYSSGYSDKTRYSNDSNERRSLHITYEKLYKLDYGGGIIKYSHRSKDDTRGIALLGEWSTRKILEGKNIIEYTEEVWEFLEDIGKAMETLKTKLEALFKDKDKFLEAVNNKLKLLGN